MSHHRYARGNEDLNLGHDPPAALQFDRVGPALLDEAGGGLTLPYAAM